MNTVFTVCSNNYLAQAKVLGESVLEHNHNTKFVIFLCDAISKNVNYEEYNKFEFIKVSDIEVPNFEFIVKNYDIIEFNTAIKPSCIKHLVKNNINAENIIYLDPDTCLFDSLDDLYKQLMNHSFILTPHILNPLPVDDLYPSESTFLNYGIYNLGFIGLNMKHPESIRLVDWWEDKTTKIGFNNPCEGLFVDQLWMAQAPIFFKDSKIIFSKGYNAAPWNLHERTDLKLKNDKYVIDDRDTLVFYHFSNIDFNNINNIAVGYNRFKSVNLSSEYTKLYENYKVKLIQNNYVQLKSEPCYFLRSETPDLNEEFQSSLFSKVRDKIKLIFSSN